jgi:hypothetical protein
MMIGIVLQIVNTTKMTKTHALTNGTIRSRFHLSRVRDAINFSMQCAILYIGLCAAMLVVLLAFVLSSKMSITTLTTHLFVFGLVTVPFGLWAKGAEGRVKNLEVRAEDPEIELKFNDYVMQWGQPRLKLQDEDGGSFGSAPAPSGQERKQA